MEIYEWVPVKCEECGTEEGPIWGDENGIMLCEDCYFENVTSGQYDEDN